MSFQTDDLALLALGILGDKPPDPDQHPLPSGMHFRWTFAEERGFPWHGFYLFRRESRPRRPKCLSQETGSLRPGLSSGSSLNTRLGRLTGAQPLRFTDDFPAIGAVEIDLRVGLRFDLYSGIQARRVDVRIGFRDAGPAVQRKCVDFRRFPLGPGPSPRTEQDVDFETESPPVSPPLSITLIESWNGSAPGLNTSRRLQVTLPREASRVDLLLTNRHGMTAEALTREGRRVAIRELPPGALQAGLVTLTGTGIAQVILQGSSTDAALLHEICFESLGTDAVESAVEVRALAGNEVAAQTVVRGTAGQVVSATLEREGITAVEISSGPAVLVDLCFLPTWQGATFGWSEVPGFTYPLCLPVAHPDYPCPGKPVDIKGAKDLALSRVTYPGPEGWEDGFTDLHSQLQILVKGGPAGGPMKDRVNPELVGDPLGPAPGAEPIRLKDQRPLDLLLLASLHPTTAQMLGLYFLDASAEPGVPYDYLLLADPTGVLGGSAATALEWLAFQPDANAVDAYLVLGKVVAPAPPVPPPGKARAYALPGAILRTQNGKLKDSQGNVGLWWEPPPEGSGEEPNLPVLFHPQRAYLGITQPAAPPPDSAYQSLGPDASAVVLTELVNPPSPPVPGETRRSPEWPPPPIAFHLIDSGPPEAGLPEGWYSYRIVSQDLFGRHSVMSPPAEWYQWDPPPPRPEDPPPPAPWYYQPGKGHSSLHPFAVALLDKIPPPAPPGVEAAALDPLDRWVLQDEPYEKWREKNPGVVGLRVGWRWNLSQMNQAPDTREFRIYYIPGRLNELPSGITLDSLRRPTNWAKRLRVVGYNENVEPLFETTRNPEGKPLEDKTAGAKASGDVVRLSGAPDLSGIQPFLDHLRLNTDTARPDRTYQILAVDPGLRTVTVDGIPSLGSPSPWTIGRPVRRYEIFLTPPDFAPGPEFEPSLDHPTVFAQIGVSAADDKTHTGDDPKWPPPAGGRFGNEGLVGGPAAIYRVLQKPPDPPELADYADKLWATPADYHSRSFFTFRWKPHTNPNVKTHILRALDDSVFQRDWLIRETREALDPVPDPDAKDAKKAHLDFFPDKWDLATRQSAVTELKKITSPASYDALSKNAWEVLALLPGNEGLGDRKALKERDWEIRQARASAIVLSDIKLPESYRKLSDPVALRILAGLPGNEDAFTQITLEPLDAAATEIEDKRGPDDPVEYTPKSTVRAYLDTLPGRATNRYFYRAAFVDGAHNRSGLSPSTPPVYLPKVEPPRAPVITRVVGGDREITIRWARNRETDLKEYRIYRSTEKTIQIRAGDLVGTITDKDQKDWTDKPVPAATTFYYQIVAVDSSDNVSEPSTTLAARAFDESAPDPPPWNEPQPGVAPSSMLLSWTMEDPNLRCLVQRHPIDGSTWDNLTSWSKPGLQSYEDKDRASQTKYVYRLRVMSPEGRVNRSFNELVV